MAITLKYFLLGEVGGFNKQTGRMDLGGIFDVVTSPVFPMQIPQVVALVGFDGVERDTIFEIRVNGPDNELIGKAEVGVPGTLTGLTAKQAIQLQKLPVMNRGRYTVDILEKTQGGFKFVASTDMFTAMYPPKRNFKDGEIEEILSKKEELITQVKTDYRVPGSEEVFKLQLNLDENVPVEEGYEGFPANDILVVDGNEHDLTGIRRNIEWMFGRPKPKKEDKVEENKVN